MTEIYDYLRLLYARIGIPHCPVCGREISQQTVDQIVDEVMRLPEGSRKSSLWPQSCADAKESMQKEFDISPQVGFCPCASGRQFLRPERGNIKLDKNRKHNIEVVVDRLVCRKDVRPRLADSVETASSISGGRIVVSVVDGEEFLYSQDYACPEHGVSIEELAPRMFSFNNPFGACKTCDGLGVFMKIDPELVVPNPKLSLAEGAIQGAGWHSADKGTIARMYYDGLAEAYGFDVREPFGKLPKEAREAVLFGTKGKKLAFRRSFMGKESTFEAPFEGVISNLERRYKESSSEAAKAEVEALMCAQPCPDCHGARLNEKSLAVTVGGINIDQFCRKSIGDALNFVENLQLTERELMIARLVLREVTERLGFLQSVGLNYLTLSRSSGTLSGGESQRIRLATQIGSSLMGVLYILDEPSIGLHQRDNDKLLATLKKLRDLGNTLVVVEHDEDTMLAADYIVDVGPGAGIHGGNVVCEGSVKDIMDCKDSLTGQYLSGRKQIEVPVVRRRGNGKFLTVKGAAENNLKNVDVSIPLGEFVCVTGVSGSGKSSLVNQILYQHLACVLNGARRRAGKHEEILGIEALDKVIDINQAPIGRTPRSNPATYIGVFNDIRDLYANTKDAKMKGYGPGRFSFNIKGGRCEACEGDGILKIEMHFLPDIYVPCEVCKGRRYNRETLDIKYKGKSIYDVLEMTVEESLEFFASVPRIERKLRALYEVGMGYVKLGQPATTLSGGEAQRVKLASELCRRSTGKTIYILDEPTMGLHSYDVHKLIGVLQQLVDAGNTVLVIEHNLDVIKVADHIIDLGPEGGDMGGAIVAQGTPEEVAAVEGSYTGRYLKKMLERDRMRRENTAE